MIFKEIKPDRITAIHKRKTIFNIFFKNNMWYAKRPGSKRKCAEDVSKVCLFYKLLEWR
jgi:hypothetical protein